MSVGAHNALRACTCVNVCVRAFVCCGRQLFSRDDRRSSFAHSAVLRATEKRIRRKENTKRHAGNCVGDTDENWKIFFSIHGAKRVSYLDLVRDN